MGYNIVKGEPLEADKLYRIYDEDALQRIAGQLCNFLSELHTINLSRFISCMEKKHDLLQEWRGLYHRIQEKLYPYMKEQACEWTDQHFRDFLTNEANAEIVPSIIHGDFGTSNILYNPFLGW